MSHDTFTRVGLALNRSQLNGFAREGSASHLATCDSKDNDTELQVRTARNKIRSNAFIRLPFFWKPLLASEADKVHTAESLLSNLESTCKKISRQKRRRASPKKHWEKIESLF